jgi:hypothetical protein
MCKHDVVVLSFGLKEQGNHNKYQGMTVEKYKWQHRVYLYIWKIQAGHISPFILKNTHASIEWQSMAAHMVTSCVLERDRGN